MSGNLDKSQEPLEATSNTEPWLDDLDDLVVKAIDSAFAASEPRAQMEDDYLFVTASSQVVASVDSAGKQTKFDVILEGFDPLAKIRVLKAVREATGLGLGEAKALVEAAPRTIKEGLSMAEAEGLRRQLEKEGASVFISYVNRKNDEPPARYILRQSNEHITDKIDEIFDELARIDQVISQRQAGIDDLKAETRELLSTLRVSIF